MTTNCRRCLTVQSRLTQAEAEVRRLARQMARTTNPTRLTSLNEQVEIQKAIRAEVRTEIDSGHDCDTRLTDEHWTRRTA